MISLTTASFARNRISKSKLEDANIYCFKVVQNTYFVITNGEI